MIRASIGALALLALALIPASICRADGPATPDRPIVAGFERFYEDAGSDAVRGGLLLLGELNCTSCHKANAAIESHVLLKKAPILDGVGSRVKVAAIRGFLADPHKAKPGTTMPHVLAGLEGKEREDAVEALVHFLATTGSTVQGKADRRTVAHGRELYREIGCLACHGPREDSSPLATSVPLPDLTAKYTLPGLTAFLANPHKVRPSGRMPSLNLDGKDAAAMANYLLRGAGSETKPNVRYQSYIGEWTKLPDFATLQPKSSGESLGFDLGMAPRKNGFAMRFEGFMRVDRDDDFTFFTTSDDGSKLWVDDKPVADSDGVHPAQTGAGRTHLSAGMHKVVVEYFDGAGETELVVEVESSNLARQPLEPFLSLNDQPPEGRRRSAPIHGQARACRQGPEVVLDDRLRLVPRAESRQEADGIEPLGGRLVDLEA